MSPHAQAFRLTAEAPDTFSPIAGTCTFASLSCWMAQDMPDMPGQQHVAGDAGKCASMEPTTDMVTGPTHTLSHTHDPRKTQSTHSTHAISAESTTQACLVPLAETVKAPNIPSSHLNEQMHAQQSVAAVRSAAAVMAPCHHMQQQPPLSTHSNCATACL
jgi:hypothetical protein